MDHRSPIFGLVILCLCTATPAAAQNKRALIEELMQVSNIFGQVQSGTQGVTAQIMKQIKKSNPSMRGDVSAYVQEKVQAQISKILLTSISKIGYQAWNETFSADELQSIINFYSSEAGQKFVRKMPILMQQLTIRLPEYLKESVPEIRDAAIEAAAEKKYHLKF